MKEELIKLGLNKFEAEIYLAALNIGPAAAASLAKAANIKRPTAYLALEGLLKLGLASESRMNGKKIFKAEPPQKLEKLTKQLRKKTVEAELLLENLLPKLSSLPQSAINESKTFTYVGLDGVKNIIYEVAASKKPSYYFGSTAKFAEKIFRMDGQTVLDEIRKLRTGDDRPMTYFITDSGLPSLKGFEKLKTPWREVKLWPKTISSGTAMVLNGSRLIIVNIDGTPFATVIESKEVVEVVKIMYQFMWNNL